MKENLSEVTARELIGAINGLTDAVEKLAGRLEAAPILNRHPLTASIRTNLDDINSPDPTTYVTVSKAAKHWHISTARIRQAIGEGIIPAFKEDNKWLIPYEVALNYRPPGSGRKSIKFKEN